MMDFPKLVRVEQSFSRERIEDVPQMVMTQLDRLDIQLQPGAKIAIAVGSRGIANLPLIVRSTVQWVRGRGAEPFIVPAMGSHGNGIAAEQQAILAALGVTQEAVGAEIRASMEVAELPGDGLECPVYMDRNAYEADGTIVINRIKVHGDFTDVTESGLLKMCAIGLGKHKQALTLHQRDIGRLRELIAACARQMIRHANLIAGIGVLENAYHDTMQIRALRPQDFETEEPGMLLRYKQIMPCFPVEDIDILVVDEIGKEISGAGMETKIVGRLRSGAPEPSSPRIRLIVTTDLTQASHGNACGVGLADIITRRLFDKIDLAATNENIVTCRCLEQGRIPIIADNDRQALSFAMRALGCIAPENMRIVRIRNTLRMDCLYLSENLLAVAKKSPNIQKCGAHAVSQLCDESDDLIPFDQLK